jgi:hypothetical protein
MPCVPIVMCGRTLRLNEIRWCMSSSHEMRTADVRFDGGMTRFRGVRYRTIRAWPIVGHGCAFGSWIIDAVARCTRRCNPAEGSIGRDLPAAWQPTAPASSVSHSMTLPRNQPICRPPKRRLRGKRQRCDHPTTAPREPRAVRGQAVTR